MRLLCLWDSPSKNTGVSCHALLQRSSDSDIEPASLTSPALVGRFFTTSATWEAPLISKQYILQTVRPERYIEIVMERMIYIYLRYYNSIYTGRTKNYKVNLKTSLNVLH